MQNYIISNGIIKFDNMYENKEIKIGFSTNILGDPGYSNKNYKERAEILKKLFLGQNLDYKNAVFQNQMHTNNVTIVDRNFVCKGKITKDDAIQNNDGMITNERGVILTAWGADCTPVYFYDHKQKVIAIAHSGRGGTRQNIVKSIIKSMKENFDTDTNDVTAILGPGICGDCYEINKKIAADFEDEFIRIENGRVFLNIKAKIKNQLKDEGIKTILDIDICTKCDTNFYSYRREGKNHGSGLGFIVLL